MGKPTVSITANQLKGLTINLQNSHWYVQDLLAIARRFPSKSVLVLPPLNAGEKKKKKATKAATVASRQAKSAGAQTGDVAGSTCQLGHDLGVCYPNLVPLDPQYTAGDIVRDLTKMLRWIDADQKVVEKLLAKIKP